VAESRIVARVPRLPLEGVFDITYRCNNRCRHCWLALPAGAPEAKDELTIDEIRRLAEDARSLGCRRWVISGGEPMLREDFADLFDILTRRSAPYLLNTNGTRITEPIARLLTRRGVKMVSLYGATAEVHDHVTRAPGSFDAALAGISRLRAAGAGFFVQLVPMRANIAEFPAMVRLAESLTPHWRLGATWLYLTARGDRAQDDEIRRQRLDPADVLAVNPPEESDDGDGQDDGEGVPRCGPPDDPRAGLFARCIAARRDFFVDPYGRMSFCSFARDPDLFHDLRRGSFREGWETFLPSLAAKIGRDAEYDANCGACASRDACGWCPMHARREHGRYGAKIDYLCALGAETTRFHEAWARDHRRDFQVGGVTVRFESDLPITERTFHPKFLEFPADAAASDVVRLRHRFSLPDLSVLASARRVYHRSPWSIHDDGRHWIYALDPPDDADGRPPQVAVFDRDHTRGVIYHDGDAVYRQGRLTSLAMFPTDQIWLAHVLAAREGCFLHSSAVVLDGAGLVAVGHSGAGKSTFVKMMTPHARVLCDDRNIIRRTPEGFRVHGCWSHGEIPQVSGASAPLVAVLFLEQAGENRLVRVDDLRETYRRLLACLIRPLVTTDWWTRMLALVERIGREVPCYRLLFDTSGDVVEVVRALRRARDSVAS
jgi:radical SAM protein with 4Fe4S-binding SPASM domain